MKRYLLILISLFISVASSYAVRARGGWHEACQSDGSKLSVMLCGDEWLHYFITRDGLPLLQTDAGDFCYADCNGFSLRPSGVLAHEASDRTLAEHRLVATLGCVENIEYLANLRRTQANSRRLERQGDFRGKYRGLVILTSFPDRPFSQDDPKAFYQRMFNEEGFSDYGATGSVRDYFLDQSNGQFDLTFDVVGPVCATRASTQYPSDYVRRYLIPEIVRAVEDSVDMKDYDWDGDGTVDQVMVLYAGYSSSDYVPADSSTYAAKNAIWPHEWTLSSSLYIDGMRIYTYACSNELWITNEPAGMGTFCHEFSHCLGLPDLYDTNYTSNGSSPNGGIMDAWELMDGGNYNNSGWTPCGYSGFERELSGWQEATLLDSPTTVSGMAPLNEGGAIYKIVNECSLKSVDEFYMLENRQQTGWDSYLPGHGLLVTHVDYSQSVWNSNTVNANLNRLRQVFIPADNNLWGYYYNLEKLTHAAYPYIDNEKGICNDSLTNTSIPAATVYNKNIQGTMLMSKPITGITEDAATGTVGFLFMGGESTRVGKLTANAPSDSNKCFDLSGRRATNRKGIRIDSQRKKYFK